MRSRSGIGLTILVILIAVTGLVLVGSVRAFENASRQTQLRVDQVKAYYLAKAGVMRAVWDWYASDTATDTNRRYTHNSVLGSNGTTVVGNGVFKYGYDGNEGSPAINQSNFAYYVMNGSGDGANWFTPSGSNRGLRQWRLYNIHTTGAITLTQMKISWSPTGTALLNDIVLNGVSVWPGGTASSGTTVDITDTTLANNGSWGGATTYIQWNSSPPDPVAVTAQFIYSGDSATLDARSHEVVLWNGSQAGSPPAQRSFTVTSTGEVTQTTGNSFKVLKSVKASVSGSLEIMDWDEGDKNIP